MDTSNLPPELIAALMRQAMSADNGMGGLTQELGAYDAMGPDVYKQHIGLGTLDQRAQLAAQQSHAGQQAVAQQIAQMQEFGRPHGGNYHTAGGAILGGLGDAVRSVGSAMGQNKLRGQQADLLKQGGDAQSGILDQMDAGRLASGNARYAAMRNYAQPGQAPQPPEIDPLTGLPVTGGPSANFQMAQLSNPLLGL